jgi:ribosome-binding protein aMBF1 (putative translation factor)
MVVNERVKEVRTPSVPAGKPYSSRLNKIAADPQKAAGVAAARARMGDWMSKEASMRPVALSALRLRAGLSQAELAEKLNTSQPNIARFEKSPGNPSLESIKGWSAALGVTITDVIAAIDAANSSSSS